MAVTCVLVEFKTLFALVEALSFWCSFLGLGCLLMPYCWLNDNLCGFLHVISSETQ